MNERGLKELVTDQAPFLPGGVPLSIGSTLLPLRKGPLTTGHIVRWCAAQQNWDKIHYDQPYAVGIAGLPSTIINGALKQHLIAQFLTEAFDGRAWIARIDYRFTSMDLVGETLEVRGRIAQVRDWSGLQLLFVDVVIHNLDQGKDTTAGTAIILYQAGGETAWTKGAGRELPEDLRLDQSVLPPDPSIPNHIRQKLGTRVEYVESSYAIDLSRLRLFAEAVGGLRAVHFDPGSAEAIAAGGVLAPPLFPIHGLEALPGRFPLSTDPRAMGREGVNEVGRDMARLFGIQIAWNGGNKVQIYSLAKAGERISAESTLVGAYSKSGRLGGRMMFFETLNRYRVAGGRELMVERQTMICRTENMGSAG
jgi:acyl dehydratase